MINGNLLRAKFVENNMTQKQVAETLEMSSKTLGIKIKKSTLGLADAKKLIELLHINDPISVFFA